MDDLATQIRSMDDALRAEMRTRWDRDLPLEELLADRWERARSLGFGEGTSIYAASYVYGRVEVGREVWIGPYTLLDGSGGLTIGDGATISAGVHLYSHDTVKRTLTGGSAPIERAPSRIGSHTYIGASAVVAKGVTIGEHVVIGACSFVNRDVPDFSVAVGAPCRVVGRVHVAEDGTVELQYD
jgi:acetyltransferase-like isoleucine patch superfamily enzyme